MKNENLIKDPQSCMCNIPGLILTYSSQSTETHGFVWEWEWNKANSMKKIHTTQYANSYKPNHVYNNTNTNHKIILIVQQTSIIYQ